MDIFTVRFKEVIDSEDIKQADLASKVGIARQCITDYKSGKSFPSIQTLSALCRALDIPSDYLLGLEDDFGAKTAAPMSAPSPRSELAEDEKQIIEKYRSLPEQLKKLVREQIAVFSERSTIQIKADNKK